MGIMAASIKSMDMRDTTTRRRACSQSYSIEKQKRINYPNKNAGHFALQASSDHTVNAGAWIMSHRYQLPPATDLAVRSWIRRHKRALRLGLLAFVLLTITAVIGLVWAVVGGASYLQNYATSKAMDWVPVQWEKKLGDIALSQIRTQTRFVNDPSVLGPLNNLAAPLLSIIPNPSQRFQLFVADAKEVNAFALPGGYLVFNKGLLENARASEQIQGVIAHEIAHVLKRHSLMQLAQTIGLDVVVPAIFGNRNPYLDVLVRNGSQLLSLKFTRDHERAADDLGWDLLQNAQINPQGMIAFFAALKSDMDAKGKADPGLGASFLSTHPTPQERIDRLEQKMAALGEQEFKSFELEFKSLRTGLKALPSTSNKNQKYDQTANAMASKL
jgi:predicted Zn-dependent protease